MSLTHILLLNENWKGGEQTNTTESTLQKKESSGGTKRRPEKATALSPAEKILDQNKITEKANKINLSINFLDDDIFLNFSSPLKKASSATKGEDHQSTARLKLFQLLNTEGKQDDERIE